MGDFSGGEFVSSSVGLAWYPVVIGVVANKPSLNTEQCMRYRNTFSA